MLNGSNCAGRILPGSEKKVSLKNSTRNAPRGPTRWQKEESCISHPHSKQPPQILGFVPMCFPSPCRRRCQVNPACLPGRKRLIHISICSPIGSHGAPSVPSAPTSYHTCCGPRWDEPLLPTHTGGGKQLSEVQWVWGWKISPKPHLLTLPGHAPSPCLFILKECKLWEQSTPFQF